jgi:hypothetical protein
MLLYGSKCWALSKEQMRRVETAKMCFLRLVMTDHKCNEDIREVGITNISTVIKSIREKLGVTNLNTVTKNYHKKWLQHFERIPENQIPKLLY